jgi:hypothetical protein
MNGQSRVYDCQQQLVRALESGDAAHLIKAASDVVKQLDVALKDLKFKRADFWGPDEPDWQPKQ